MIRSAQSTVRQISRLARPTPSSEAPLLLVPFQTHATESTLPNNENHLSEYEQIMRMGVYYRSSSPSSKASSSSTSRASKSTRSGSDTSSSSSSLTQQQQEAVSKAYRSVAEPTVYEDYDSYESMHHHPGPVARSTVHSSYRNSSVIEGEAGSVV